MDYESFLTPSEGKYEEKKIDDNFLTFLDFFVKIFYINNKEKKFTDIYDFCEVLIEQKYSKFYEDSIQEQSKDIYPYYNYLFNIQLLNNDNKDNSSNGLQLHKKLYCIQILSNDLYEKIKNVLKKEFYLRNNILQLENQELLDLYEIFEHFENNYNLNYQIHHFKDFIVGCCEVILKLKELIKEKELNNCQEGVRIIQSYRKPYNIHKNKYFEFKDFLASSRHVRELFDKLKEKKSSNYFLVYSIIFLLSLLCLSTLFLLQQQKIKNDFNLLLENFFSICFNIHNQCYQNHIFIQIS